MSCMRLFFCFFHEKLKTNHRHLTNIARQWMSRFISILLQIHKHFMIALFLRHGMGCEFKENQNLHHTNPPDDCNIFRIKI